MNRFETLSLEAQLHLDCNKEFPFPTSKQIPKHIAFSPLPEFRYLQEGMGEMKAASALGLKPSLLN